MAWDACAFEPNVFLRWVECHPASTGAAQALVGVLAIAVALWAATSETRNARKTRREYEHKLTDAFVSLSSNINALTELHDINPDNLDNSQCARIAEIGKNVLKETEELISLISEIIEISRLSSFKVTRAILAVKTEGEATRQVFEKESNWLDHPTKNVIRNHIESMSYPLSQLQDKIQDGLDALGRDTSWRDVVGRRLLLLQQNKTDI